MAESGGPHVARIVISGYYGFGNVGDEAVLAGMIASLREASAEDLDIIALSSDPSSTARMHGIQAVDRYAAGEVIRSIRRADLLISGGGSLLQDVTSSRSLLYYLGILRLARLLRRKTMIYAQGIGPIRRRANRYLTHLELDRVSAITVRDEGSRRMLMEIGVKRPPIEVAADPSFAVEPAPKEDAFDILSRSGVPPGAQLLGIALRPWQGQDRWLAEAAAGLSLAVAKLGLQPIFLPMQPSTDIAIAEETAKIGGIPPVIVREMLSPATAKAIAGSVSIVVAMRLHALIFAASVGVPCIALSYDPKVEEFARSMDITSIELASLSAAELETAILAVWERRHELGGLIAERARDLRKKAARSAEIACRLLQGEGQDK